MKTTFLLVVSFLALVVLSQCSKPSFDNERVIAGKGVETPLKTEWLDLNAKPQPDEAISFKIALRQRNVDVLESILLDVSNPRSSQYGKYLSIDEILDIVAPPKEEHDVVVEWLESEGIAKSQIISVRDALKIETTIRQAEKLLDTEFHLFQSLLSGSTKSVVLGSYSVPKYVAERIDMITGLTEFPKRINRNIQQKLGVAAPPQSPYLVVPETISNLYNIPDANAVITNTAATQGVVEFLGYGSFVESDLSTFFQGVGLPFDNTTLIVGPYYPNGFLESELDIQYIMAVARNATSYYWTVTGWMYDFAIDAFNDKDIPLVYSMSYGWTERSQCNLGGMSIDNCTTSETYVNRTNVEFMKLGTRGVTLLAASGDLGAPGDSDSGCFDILHPLNPLYPAASPYVLSVGATMLAPETAFTNPKAPICNGSGYTCAESGTEISCMFPTALITSGGGFSEYSQRPSYQEDAVNAYLSSGARFPPELFFKKENRGIPDVAGVGHSYLIVDEGAWTVVDGTSCSTPMWGAIITILNNIRLNAGKPPLGFVNPFLYQTFASNPSAFNDITVGNNKCTEEICCLFGYEAAAGWDAVTGLGTPNVEQLIAAVQSLP